jgi:hypothetical protein
LELEDHPFE